MPKLKPHIASIVFFGKFYNNRERLLYLVHIDPIAFRKSSKLLSHQLGISSRLLEHLIFKFQQEIELVKYWSPCLNNGMQHFQCKLDLYSGGAAGVFENEI